MEDFLLLFSLVFLMLQLLHLLSLVPTFGPLERPKVNQIQFNALRFFFGLGKVSPIAAHLRDSGWVPANPDEIGVHPGLSIGIVSVTSI